MVYLLRVEVPYSSAIRWGLFLDLSQISKLVLFNSAVRWVYLFQNNPQKCRSILKDGCRFLGLFCRGKTSILQLENMVDSHIEYIVLTFI